MRSLKISHHRFSFHWPDLLNLSTPFLVSNEAGFRSYGAFLFYMVSHIKCSTARYERGCTACPRREQGKAI
jgi:hypothetical protein